MKEDRVEFAILLREDSEPVSNGKDRVAMGDVLDHFVVDIFCELHGSLGSA